MQSPEANNPTENSPSLSSINCCTTLSAPSAIDLANSVELRTRRTC